MQVHHPNKRFCNTIFFIIDGNKGPCSRSSFSVNEDQQNGNAIELNVINEYDMTSKTDIELIDQEETESNGVQPHQPDCTRYPGTSNASKTSSPTTDKAKKNNVTFREGEAQKSYHANSYFF